VSPLVATLFALVTILFLTPLFKNLPEAVLAALIIHAVSHLMKVHEFRLYYGELRPEFWLGLATLVGVITLDVLPGLVIGIASMLLLVVYDASRPRLSVLGAVPGAPGAFGDVGRHPDYEELPNLLVLRLEAPLLYVNASLVREHIKKLVGAADPIPRAVILDMGANGDQLDITGAETLTQLITELRHAGVDLALVEMRLPVRQMARRSGLLDALGEERIFNTIREAVLNFGLSPGDNRE
jgi:MFS superfamily sulfate permease-like transporter